MPAVAVPESGWMMEGPGQDSLKPGSAVRSAIGLTLTNGMIEDMIRCVQDGKPIQLSLGPQPNLSFGNNSKPLSTYEDNFTHELYFAPEKNHHDSDTMAPNKTGGVRRVENKFHPAFQAMFNPKGLALKKFNAANGISSAAAESSVSTKPATVEAGEDQALNNLRNSMNAAVQRKSENTTKLIQGPKGQLKKAGHKLLNPKLDASRSLSGSPSHMGGSPSLGPTSVPASEQAAKLAKTIRKPVVHYLALEALSKKELRQKLPTLSNEEFDQALSKVADEDMSTHKYFLKRNAFKELDVWTFNYDTEADREKVIQIAIKKYDNLRLASSEPEWERLKPLSQRGDGQTLSRLQAKIATNSIPRTPKINVSKADSGRDTPTNEDDLGDDSQSKGDMAPKSSQMKKKANEKEAPKKSTAPVKKTSKPAPKPAPKKTSKAAPQELSAQFVNDSDEEDDYMTQKEAPAPKPAPKPITKPASKPVVKPIVKPAPKVQAKRPREDDSSTSSDSSIPLSKKVKKDIINHRISDASQSSLSSNKTKGTTSPQKSSPLASSPPTNASNFDESSSASSTPRHLSTKHSRSPIHKRHQKSSSVTSSLSSSSSNYPNLSAEILNQASKYRSFYPKYVELYKELASMTEVDEEKKGTLLEMHTRLLAMKKAINKACGL